MLERAIDKTLGLLDGLAPRPRSDAPEERRQARAVVAAALIATAILTFTAVSSFALGLDRRLAPLNLAWAAAVLALLLVARRRRSMPLLANALVTLGFTHALTLSALAGGRNVGALFAFAVFPMLAVLLAGWRSGLVFTGLSSAAVILTPMVPLTILAPAGVGDAPVAPALVRDALNVIFAVGLVAALYDVVRTSTLRDAQRSRARAEKAAARQHLLVDLSRHLHDARGEEVDEVLARAMERTARLAGANRTVLQLLPGAGFVGRFVWGEGPCGDPAAVQEPARTRRAFPWTSERISDGRIAQVRRLDELPPEADAERAYLESRGVASWLCVPIQVAGRTIGYQSFETTEEHKVWDEEEVAALRLMTEILGSTVLRHRTEQALRESEEKFAIAFRDHPDAMFIADLETLEILECNDQWLIEAGRATREDVVGRRPWDFDFALPMDKVEAMTRLLGTEGHLPAVELSLTGRGGEQRTYLVSATRIVLGGRACALANIHDLTERQQLEHQLLHAQKMEAVGRLAGGVAHDYNNMLTVISAYSAGLVERLDGDLRRDAEEIYEAARRSAELTRQLLAFSRRQVLQTEVLDPNRLLSGLETMLRPLIGESIGLRLDLADAPGLVSSDRGQLEQAVVNLVVNGRDAMRDGGTLTVRTRRVTVPGPEVAARVAPPDVAPGAYVVIGVEDEGEGMDPELVEHVMEPFYTTKPEGQGTGLGLPMAHGLARQCGGALVLESERGRGTRAAIYLPVVDATPGAAAVGPMRGASPEAPSNVRILLVEDEARVRRLAARTLREAGYHVIEEQDGRRARERATALGDGFDLLVSDVVMPHLSGPALARALREERPDLPVVLMSGYPDADGRPIPDDVALLLKPFGAEDLRLAVARALRPKPYPPPASDRRPIA